MTLAFLRGPPAKAVPRPSSALAALAVIAALALLAIGFARYDAGPQGHDVITGAVTATADIDDLIVSAAQPAVDTTASLAATDTATYVLAAFLALPLAGMALYVLRERPLRLNRALKRQLNRLSSGSARLGQLVLATTKTLVNALLGRDPVPIGTTTLATAHANTTASSRCFGTALWVLFIATIATALGITHLGTFASVALIVTAIATTLILLAFGATAMGPPASITVAASLPIMRYGEKSTIGQNASDHANAMPNTGDAGRSTTRASFFAIGALASGLLHFAYHATSRAWNAIPATVRFTGPVSVARQLTLMLSVGLTSLVLSTSSVFAGDAGLADSSSSWTLFAIGGLAAFALAGLATLKFARR